MQTSILHCKSFILTPYPLHGNLSNMHLSGSHCFCRFALPAMRRPTPLCFAGSAPALLLAAIFRGRARRARPLLLLYVLLLGAEPEGLDPYCYCMFYYYYYYYYYSSSRPMGVNGSPMKGTWENDEIWHTLRYGHK